MMSEEQGGGQFRPDFRVQRQRPQESRETCPFKYKSGCSSLLQSAEPNYCVCFIVHVCVCVSCVCEAPLSRCPHLAPRLHANTQEEIQT